jgi:ADP-ribosyl-[dinitrogen reductase] hydrolase
MRTSHSHPLQIAEVQSAPGRGLIGITFCPGKQQPGALTGAWDRDLATDLDLIRDWGAVAVVTLVEGHELKSLKVQEMGSLVAARHMSWLFPVSTNGTDLML